MTNHTSPVLTRRAPRTDGGDVVTARLLPTKSTDPELGRFEIPASVDLAVGDVIEARQSHTLWELVKIHSRTTRFGVSVLVWEGRKAA